MFYRFFFLSFLIHFFLFLFSSCTLIFTLLFHCSQFLLIYIYIYIYIIGSTCVEHFSNCSIAGFAEGFSFLLTTDCVSLDFFQGADEVGLFFLFDLYFFLFPPGGDSRYFYLFLAVVFLVFSGTVNAGRY